MRGFNRGNHFGGVLPIPKRQVVYGHDIDYEVSQNLSLIKSIPGGIEGMDDVVEKGLRTHLDIVKSVDLSYTFHTDMCEPNYEDEQYKYPELLLMSDYAEPKLSKKPSLAPFYALCDLQLRRPALERLHGLSEVASLTDALLVKTAGVLNYALISDKIFEKPRFVTTETDNGYDRKGALKKFVSVSQPEVVFLLGGGSGGGECITVLGHGVRKVVVISFIGYDTTEVVREYYLPIFQSIVLKGGTGCPTELCQVYFPYTYDQMRVLTPSDFVTYLFSQGVTIKDLGYSAGVSNFFCELDPLLSVFRSSFMIYADLDTTIDLPVVTLPIRHPDMEYDSFYLTQWMLSKDPVITAGQRFSWYDPDKKEIAVYAEHAAFRDRVFERNQFRSRIGVIDVKLTDFLGAQAKSRSRLRIRIGSGTCINPTQLGSFVQTGVVDVSLFYVPSSSSMYLPALQVHLVVYANPLELVDDRELAIPYVGRYYYFKIGDNKLFVDYSDYSRSYAERLMILRRCGFNVFSPASVPRWALNYVVMTGLGSFSFKMVISRNIYITTFDEIDVSMSPAVTILGMGYNKNTGLVRNLRSKVIISPALASIDSLNSKKMKFIGGYTDSMKGRFVRLLNNESLIVSVTDNDSLESVTLEYVMELCDGLEPHYSSLLIEAFHRNHVT